MKKRITLVDRACSLVIAASFIVVGLVFIFLGVTFLPIIGIILGLLVMGLGLCFLSPKVEKKPAAPGKVEADVGPEREAHEITEVQEAA